jgi:putative transcriptional regulator
MAKPTRVSNDIRSLRYRADEMTHTLLAERVGVTRQTIIAIEQGRYSPALVVAFRIADALGVSLDRIRRWLDEHEVAGGDMTDVADSFFNVSTPADLATAEERAASG